MGGTPKLVLCVFLRIAVLHRQASLSVPSTVMAERLGEWLGEGLAAFGSAYEVQTPNE